MKRHRFMILMCAVLGLAVSPGNGFAQFTNALSVPDLLDDSVYVIHADVEQHDFGRTGYDNVTTFAYNYAASDSNTYLGPTLVWRVGRTQTTYIVNNLGTNNTTTVHWHGANIPAYTDGGPHQYIPPGDTFAPSFPVIEAPASLWYHPHAEDVTYTQVQMGLAGMIIIKDANDPVEPVVPHTYGVDDFPIIIQDLKVSNQGVDTLQSGPRNAVINGTIQPYLDVPPQPIRFRILDGSTRNAFMLAVVSDTNNTASSQRHPYKLLASDGGYLSDSVRTIDSLLTGPGIRNEIIVDFSNNANSTFYLVNLSGSIPANTVADAKGNALVQIRVGSTPNGNPGAIPSSLPNIPALGTPQRTRTINLNGKSGPNVADSLKFSINDRQYEFTVIDDTVNLGDIEDWVIVNNSTVAHPFHIHLVQFFVQSVTDLNNNPLPMPVEYLGPNDDILVQAGHKVTFRASFDSYASPMPFNVDDDTYMYHCHILTHEDGYYALGGGGGNTNPTITQRAHWGMMQQFVVWDGTVSRDFSKPLGEKMVLFPNPARDQINLNGESLKISTLRIYDLQGKQLIEKLLPPFNGTVSVDVHHLPPGMVVVELQSRDGKFAQKVVIR